MSNFFDKLESQVFEAWAFDEQGAWRQEHLPLGYWKPALADHSISDGLERAAWALVDGRYGPEENMPRFEKHGPFVVVLRIANATAQGDTLEETISIPWAVVFNAWADSQFAQVRADIYRASHDAYGRLRTEAETWSTGQALAHALGFRVD